RVQSADISAKRGYRAKAGQMRVSGLEADVTARIGPLLSLYAALAYTNGRYVDFANAPPPLEEVGGPTFKDISGGKLPGISEWATSLGGEVSTNTARLLGQEGEWVFAVDGFYRSSFSSSASPSKYLVVNGYTLVNGRAGFRTAQGVSLFVWGRNVFDTDYFEQLLPAGGSAGHYSGVLGDPRTYGVTLRYAF